MGYLRFKPGPSLQRLTFYAWDTGVTRYFNERLGVTVDGRGYYGTAYVGLNLTNSTRPAISQYDALAGPAYRFYLQPRYSISGRVIGGYAYGNFSADTNGFGARNPRPLIPMGPPSPPAPASSANSTLSPTSASGWLPSTSPPASAPASKTASDLPAASSTASENSNQQSRAKESSRRMNSLALPFFFFFFFFLFPQFAIWDAGDHGADAAPKRHRLRGGENPPGFAVAQGPKFIIFPHSQQTIFPPPPKKKKKKKKKLPSLQKENLRSLPAYERKTFTRRKFVQSGALMAAACVASSAAPTFAEALPGDRQALAH